MESQPVDAPTEPEEGGATTAAAAEPGDGEDEAKEAEAAEVRYPAKVKNRDVELTVSKEGLLIHNVPDASLPLALRAAPKVLRTYLYTAMDSWAVRPLPLPGRLRFFVIILRAVGRAV